MLSTHLKGCYYYKKICFSIRYPLFTTSNHHLSFSRNVHAFCTMSETSLRSFEVIKGSSSNVKTFIIDDCLDQCSHDVSVAAACSPVCEVANQVASDSCARLKPGSTRHYPCPHTDQLDPTCTADHYKHLQAEASLEGV